MSIYSIGLSALKAYSTKLETTAGNLANINTPGNKAGRVETIEAPSGGVSVSLSKNPSTAQPQNTPENQSAQVSDVDLATEIVDLTTTQRGYEANLKVLQTSDETLGKVLDIIS